jgi:hypothetical protein
MRSVSYGSQEEQINRKRQINSSRNAKDLGLLLFLKKRKKRKE